MGTLGRTVEIRRFLEFLTRQTCRNARVIVVDQNPDELLVPVIAEFVSEIPVLHLRADVGLSLARNVGLRNVTADVVAFPDDDCWYPPDLLERVTETLAERPTLDGLHGQAIDERGRPTSGREDRRPGALTRYNVWRRVGSYKLFVRRRVVERTGPFDEMLGVGSPGPWGSGEDLDYVLRSLASGFAIDYDPSLLVYHMPRRERSARPAPDVGYRYGMGIGRVMRTSRLPAWLASYLCARAFVGAAMELARARPELARFHWAVGRGRLRGWLRSPPAEVPRTAPSR
jgi:glycosyltransferase involved in cell wall biosynthesis